MTEGESSAAAPKRRVRTGCLTCRRRRRKCPEERPVCSNCKEKNLQCRYGVQVVFIDADTGERERMPDPPRRKRKDQGTAAETVQKPAATLDTCAAQSHTPRDDDTGILDGLSGQGIHLERFDTNARDAGLSSHVDLTDEGGNEDSSRFGISNILQAATKYPLSASYPESSSVQAWSTSPRAIAQLGVSSTLTKDEIEALVYYRYHIAPVLDLGVGTLYFGISVPAAATQDIALRDAITALVIAHKFVNAKDDTNSVQQQAAGPAFEHHELGLTSGSAPEYQCVVAMLIALKQLQVSPLEYWSHILARLLQELNPISVWIKPDARQVIQRIALASGFLSKHAGQDLDLSLIGIGKGPQTWHHVDLQPPSEQFTVALQLLHESLRFLLSTVERQRDTHFPLVSAWQKCWSESQMWYCLRVQDLRQILEIPAADNNDSSIAPDHSFPTIVFSNACAVHSNVCHHTTAIMLLQNKPRLARATAESGSSVSAIWHALRVISIVANASEAILGDALILAALVTATRVFSHAAQRAQAIHLATRVATLISPHAQTFISQTFADFDR